MKLRFSAIATVLGSFLASGFAADGASTVAGDRLWYEQPAAKWTEALPIGNGTLGAMVFGGLASERIQFNEDTLWRGKPHDYVRDGAGTHLAEIRRLVAAGEIEAASALVRSSFLSDPVRQLPYQPFGDVRLAFAGHESATDYVRELDLDDAVARTSYAVGEVRYTREIFASAPARAVVIHLAADRPGSLSFGVGLDSPHARSATSILAQDTLVLAGSVQDDGLRFESRLRVVTCGGRIEQDGSTLRVVGADSATLMLTAATSFVSFQDISGDPSARCTSIQAALRERAFADLRAEHVADYRELTKRVSLDLGTSGLASLPTDQRLRSLKQGGLAADPQLAALYFQFGRYLLISSSRPGRQPANLQGVWNEELNPPWESKYTTNINCEMNYWPAELTNLAECHESLFSMIDDLVVSGARTARKQYGARGWVLHHNTDLWRGTAPINNIDGVWPTGGAWLCHHLWEHWLFTGDRVFLEKRAYPAMKGAAEFFVDTLIEDPKTGWLVTSPSFSPEQGTLTMGPTMDMQLIRALFSHVIEAAGILGIDAEFVGQLQAMKSRLAPNQIGRHGQLQEWLDDVDVPNNAHRHMSPLWALYPGADITPEDPAMFAAASKLLTWRGDGNTGWSYAWRIPLWARVHDGDFAFRQLGELLRRRTLPNFFDLCGPFQIDGNFGATAGIAEMLVQSHRTAPDQADAVLIEILPALPKAWPTGSVRGLRARGGFEVDIVWRDGKASEVTLRSKLGRPCRLCVGDQTSDLTTKPGQELRFDGQLHSL